MKEEENEFNQKSGEPYNTYERRIIDVEEALIAKFRAEIANNKAMQDYLNRFEEKSIESFLNNYLSKKVSAYRFSKMYEKMNDDHDMQWVKEAEKHLIIIQQKKLFDMQCLWRAEKVEIKLVEICNDFEFWSKHVLDCPFIDPITEEDIEIYKKYIDKTKTDYIDDYWPTWQHYDLFNREVDNKRKIKVPDWYRFYDKYKGASELILLPNIRGKKERKYFEMAWKANSDKYKEEKRKAEIENPPDKRPPLNDYKLGYMEKFIERFEDKETKKNFKAYFIVGFKMEKNEYIDSYLKVLKESDEPIKFEEDDDWDSAVKKTVDKYRAKKGFEFLPVAYGHYKLKEITGNQIDISEVSKTEGIMQFESRELLLYGRELLGEPRNLDF